MIHECSLAKSVTPGEEKGESMRGESSGAWCALSSGHGGTWPAGKERERRGKASPCLNPSESLQIENPISVQSIEYIHYLALAEMCCVVSQSIIIISIRYSVVTVCTILNKSYRYRNFCCFLGASTGCSNSAFNWILSIIYYLNSSCQLSELDPSLERFTHFESQLYFVL